MTLLTAKFAQIDAQIDAKNAQIIALQTELTELQEHRQQLLSVEQAIQSALSQVDTALSRIHHVNPTQVKIFRDALVDKFAPGAIGILEPATTTPAEPIEPKPIEPTAPEPSAPDIEPALDVEVATATDMPAADESVASTTPDIEGLLNKLSIQSIRKLAAAKGVNGIGTRAAIAERLKAIVTNADLRAIC